MTTNGILLKEHLPALIEAKIDGINISLDALDSACYHEIVRHGELAQALSGLDAAWEAGVRPLKVNCVLMRGLNDKEAPGLAALARERDISVRFIELMPIGFGKSFAPVPGREIFKELSAVYGEPEPFCGIIGNGPAAYYTFPGFCGKIGFIDAVSHRFCASCNRVRLTSDGKLKLCLHFEQHLELLPLLHSGCSDEEIRAHIIDAIENKPASHRFNDVQAGHTESRTMNTIGG